MIFWTSIPRLTVRRSRYTNDPYVIARNDNVVSVNASLQIDLTGQVCAESIGPLPALRHRGPRTLPGGPTMPRAAGPSWPRRPPPSRGPSPGSSPHPGPGGHCLRFPQFNRSGGHGVRRGQAPPAHSAPAGGKPHRRGPPGFPGRAAAAGQPAAVFLMSAGREGKTYLKGKQQPSGMSRTAAVVFCGFLRPGGSPAGRG